MGNEYVNQQIQQIDSKSSYDPTHQISHLRPDGCRCIKDNVDNLSKESVLVDRRRSHLADGPEN